MRWLWIPVGVCVLLAAVIVVGFTQLPGIGAGGLLHPARRAVTDVAPKGCDDATFAGDEGLRLRGWRCRATGPRRATLVYLHGIADNRSSAAGIVERLGARGFDTIAYDSRSHGDSDGDLCTYGFFEKRDLHRVGVDEVNPAAAAARISSPVLLIHGAADVDTPPDHSRRVLAALSGTKRLILVPGAGHNQSLGGQNTWDEIDQWLEAVLARPGRNFATPIADR